MASRFNTLLYGELQDVCDLLDDEVDAGEVRAVLCNLCDRVQRLEQIAHKHATLPDPEWKQGDS